MVAAAAVAAMLHMTLIGNVPSTNYCRHPGVSLPIHHCTVDDCPIGRSQCHHSRPLMLVLLLQLDSLDRLQHFPNCSNLHRAPFDSNLYRFVDSMGLANQLHSFAPDNLCIDSHQRTVAAAAAAVALAARKPWCLRLQRIAVDLDSTADLDPETTHILN